MPGAGGHYRDPALDFISPAKSSPRHVACIIFSIHGYYMYIAVMYARQIDMTFNSFSFTKYYWILLSVAYNFILVRIFQFFKFIMCHLILFPPIFSIFLIYNVPTVSTAIRPLNIFTKELNFLPKKYFISWKMWYPIRQISNFSANQCISD